MKRRLYIEMALLCILLAFICFLFKIIRIPGDSVIVTQPDTSLHDVIYFQAESFVNLFGLLCTVNLCYFIEGLYSKSQLIRFITSTLLIMTGLMTCRAVCNFVTYYTVTLYEIAIDILLTLLLIYFRYLRSHANTRSTPTTSRTIPVSH